jgi:hypothetical protein
VGTQYPGVPAREGNIYRDRVLRRREGGWFASSRAAVWLAKAACVGGGDVPSAPRAGARPCERQPKLQGRLGTAQSGSIAAPPKVLESTTHLSKCQLGIANSGTCDARAWARAQAPPHRAETHLRGTCATTELPRRRRHTEDATESHVFLGGSAGEKDSQLGRQPQLEPKWTTRYTSSYYGNFLRLHGYSKITNSI